MLQYMPIDHVHDGNGGYKRDLLIGILTPDILSISYFFQSSTI
jgi:hypothetical protein